MKVQAFSLRFRCSGYERWEKQWEIESLLEENQLSLPLPHGYLRWVANRLKMPQCHVEENAISH